ncbi:hypothetical protein ACFW16_27110 [Inquilinus sp. NPDC058860]|uniref:hypothetical protein n=1 Tax=Inquilinus sp. NPDC058860 TaxID=3346652 RepID=UPI0036B7612A
MMAGIAIDGLKSSVWRIGGIGALALLVACGPTPSEMQLNYASQRCSYGDPYACNALGQLSTQAQIERRQQDTNTALAVGALALGGLAIAAAADNDYDDGWRRRRWRHDGWGYRGRYRRW